MYNIPIYFFYLEIPGSYNVFHFFPFLICITAIWRCTFPPLNYLIYERHSTLA